MLSTRSRQLTHVRTSPNPADNMESRNGVCPCTNLWVTFQGHFGSHWKEFLIVLSRSFQGISQQAGIGLLPPPYHPWSWTSLREMLLGWQQVVMDGLNVAAEWQGCWSVSQACVYKKEEAVSWSEHNAALKMAGEIHHVRGGLLGSWRLEQAFRSRCLWQAFLIGCLRESLLLFLSVSAFLMAAKAEPRSREGLF